MDACAALASLAKRFPGTLGVAAVHLETGGRVAYHPHRRLLTASTYKSILLVSVLERVDAGDLSLDDRLVFTRAKRVAGSGVLKAMSSETEFSIGDLAVLMITISDNTASQMLFEVVGHGRLEATIERLGMTGTRIPLSPQDMLLGIVGLDSTMGPGVFDLSMERLLHRRYDFDHRAYSPDGNVSTPADMCRLFQRIHSNEALSAEGAKTFLDVHKNQQLRTVIPHLLPAGTVCAHKTGQFEAVSCDVGIVYAGNGPYAIAIMANDAGEDRTELNRALAALSRSVFDGFARSGA